MSKIVPEICSEKLSIECLFCVSFFFIHRNMSETGPERDLF